MKLKKIIIFTLLFLTFTGIFIYQKMNSTNKKNNIKITLDSSKEFSREELDKGVEKVLSSFNSTWSDSKLHEIRFDNNIYQQEMANRDMGTSLFSDLDKNNILIFTLSFTTGNKVTSGVGSNTSIDKWLFILSRKNKESAWEFLDQGI